MKLGGAGAGLRLTVPPLKGQTQLKVCVCKLQMRFHLSLEYVIFKKCVIAVKIIAGCIV